MESQKAIYHKYNITKADGTPVEGDYFVLKPEADRAAQEALAAYAATTKNIALAKDLWVWLRQIDFFYRGHPIDRVRLETLREFVRRVNKQAEANIEKTSKLEGSHCVAMQSVFAEMADELTSESDERWITVSLAKKGPA